MATQFGEAFVGEGAQAAHLNTVLGAVGGPVETAWITALATPREHHAAFVVVAAPGTAVRPFTLFVNKAAIAGERHGALTWGAAQAGVAGGVLDAVADGVIDPDAVHELLLIAAVWVNPDADDEGAVYDNNRQATRRALELGRAGRPSVPEAMALRERPWNAFFTAPPGV
jgi:5,6,7,8-tetrahydromethanopterin hydro-lyase